MTDWTERYYCPECEVVFHEPFPEYADVTPCIYCKSSAEAAWVPEGTTGFVKFSEMIDFHDEHTNETN
jgi:hypothetical protein